MDLGILRSNLKRVVVLKMVILHVLPVGRSTMGNVLLVSSCCCCAKDGHKVRNFPTIAEVKKESKFLQVYRVMMFQGRIVSMHSKLRDQSGMNMMFVSYSL